MHMHMHTHNSHTCTHMCTQGTHTHTQTHKEGMGETEYEKTGQTSHQSFGLHEQSFPHAGWKRMRRMWGTLQWGKLRLDELLDGKDQFETKRMEAESLPAELQVKESLSGPQLPRLPNGITVSHRVVPIGEGLPFCHGTMSGQTSVQVTQAPSPCPGPSATLSPSTLTPAGRHSRTLHCSS